MAAVERQPFGEVSSGRLQQLASAKNRQAGLFTPKDAQCKSNTFSPGPTKRSFAMSTLNDDSENQDPSSFCSASKKNKFELFSTPIKPLSLCISTETRPREIGTVLSPTKAPMSAPAGRSPKRKIAGLAGGRRSLVPSYARVEPPFVSRTSATLPFSLDAALSSTLGPRSAPIMPAKPMPSKWKFDIHEDTPEEESATLMEHSTLTLDLSSDDESNQTKKADRGKENTPPEGYDAPIARSASEQSTSQVDIIRRQLDIDQMDDGQRTPLSDLDVEPFNTTKVGEPSFIVVTAEESDCPIVAPSPAKEATAPVTEIVTTASYVSAVSSTNEVTVSVTDIITTESVASASEPKVADISDKDTIIIFEDAEAVVENIPAIKISTVS